MKVAKKESAAKKGKASTKFKKAPEAPKRFKSAFIIFSAEKHKVIKKGLKGDGRPVKTTDVAKMVSDAWKKLTPDEKKHWDALADEDKARYEREKMEYKGPWKVPSNKRKTKDPTAPKRPSSAFLAYSNSRRAELKRQNPKATNADLSRMLSKSWKALPPTERAVYMAEERKLREKYKNDMEEWRVTAAKRKEEERKNAAQAAETQQSHQRPQHDTEGQFQQLLDDPHQSLLHQQMQDQQQQLDMAGGNMFNNPYLQAAAFGGGVGQGMDARAAALGLNPAAANPFFANAYASQPYGMPGVAGGNPALSLFGQSYTQNTGFPGQLPGGLYGQNFGGAGGMSDSGQGGGPSGSYGGQY